MTVIVPAGTSLFAVTQSEAQRVAPCTGGPTLHNVVAPVIPRTFDNAAVAPGADCIARQEFIYLNWQVDPARPGMPSSAPASTFGTPGDTTPTVWRSYLEASAVFNPPARAPQSASPGSNAARRQLPLTRTSTVRAAAVDLRDPLQAGGGWLTSQSGRPTYYDVRINQDEVDYIKDNKLTTFAGQAACVLGKGGFNLPHGSTVGNVDASRDTDCRGTVRKYGQDIGAIETKAAWIVLPADGSLDYR